MNPLAQFFETNRVIVYSVYGQVFFVMGLAVALQTRSHSRLEMARSLWILAAFGIVHGLHEWGYVFIPIQETYMPSSVIAGLKVARVLMLALSYFFLLQFGLELVVSGLRGGSLLRLLGVGAFSVWVILFLVLMVSRGQTALDTVMDLGAVWGRYLLGAPGAIMVAIGLLRQERKVRSMDLPVIAYYLRGAMVAFAVYAIVGGMVVPQAGFFPASVLNETTLLTTTGIPAPIYRSLSGLAMAYFIIRTLEVFDLETERFIEEIERARILAADRERIGRELHDGIIQRIYAAGLSLEDARLTIMENPQTAQAKIATAMGMLNTVIQDIRSYIFDLRTTAKERDLPSALATLAQEFRVNTLIDVDVQIQGAPCDLSAEQVDHLVSIVQEALTNVSQHARATHVDIRLEYAPDAIHLIVQDNGIGFQRRGEMTTEPGRGQGLRNMQERARLLGGQLSVAARPQPERGTIVRLILPIPIREKPALA